MILEEASMNEKKTVLITGASGGIGRAAALAFARTKRYNLVLGCCRNEEALRAYNDTLVDTYGVTSVVVRANVGDRAEVEHLFSEAEKAFGGVDILINNAGISFVGLLTDMTDADWDQILATNLSSCFYCSRRAIPYMLHQKDGRIINVSSVWGNAGASCEVAYSATKGGVNAMTKALAKELAPSGIQVNAAAFGCIDTEMNGHLSEEDKAELSYEIPMGRFAAPEEAGNFLLALAESERYLTGQILTFDGGWC